MGLKRRQFIQGAALAAAGTTVIAAPAIANSAPDIKWRLTSGFPKSLDTIYGTAEVIARYVAEATDNRFQIQPFGAGEIVGGLQSVDAVMSGTVEMAHTAAFYNFGKDPTWGLSTSVPFLMGKRAQDAWLYQGGGQDMINRFFAKAGIIGFPGGNTGTQMGGWFRREIRSVADITGLKMRVGGITGRVLQRMGAVPQQLAGGDIYPALERGTIDAAEWVGAYDDEKLGFNKVAPFYYYPGWQEGASVLHTMVNLQKFNELPKTYQRILEMASTYGNTHMMAMYDARNPPALRRLMQGGAQLRAFPADVLDAANKAATELYTEISGQNADFKAMYDNAVAFRNDFYLYNQIADFSFDTFIIRSRARG
jgi:TRAP-type mannitol/chloroaromatic compound transport system substrate-binding protein